MNKLKKYSFYIWLIAAVIIFFGANKIYRYYQTKQIIQKSFVNQTDSKNSSNNNENGKVNAGKPQKNAEGMPLVPDFTLKNEKGEAVSLSDYSGKVVVLNFWASWCPPCRAEMPEFNELNAELKGSKDVVLLSINMTDGQRETKDKAIKFLKDNNYNLNVLFDEEGAAAGIFGITNIPTTAIIDKDGYLHDYIMGETTKSAVLKSVGEVK